MRGFEVVSKYNDQYNEGINESINKGHIWHKVKDGTYFSFTYPSRATKGSAGYDLYNNTGEDIVLEPGQTSKAITTYLKAYMLQDEVLQLYPRSSHGFKYVVMLANTVGIIDSDYYNNKKNEGEIFVKLHNNGKKKIIVPHGEAFVQGIFSKYLTTDDDKYTVGGERNGGIGSTT